MSAGKDERKNPAIGIKTNSRGNINCLNLDASEYFFDLRSKSIYKRTNKANRHNVRINPERRGKLYPRLVLEKTGLRSTIRLAEIVIMYQLTGHNMWSKSTFPTR